MKSPHTSQASRRYHDRVANQYDNIYDDPYWRFHDEITWRLIKPYLPSDLSPQYAAADLGCGTGKWGLKLLKSGFTTFFVDHSPAMIERTRLKLPAAGPRAARATLLVGDLVDLSSLPQNHFRLVLAMGDPLSICSDPAAAARQMFSICKPGAWVIASADNKLAAIDHLLAKGDMGELEQFVHTGKTRWLTRQAQEQFTLTMFTPASLKRLFADAGFDELRVTGKTLLPIRKHPELLTDRAQVDRLLKLEVELAKDESAAAAANHLQIAARKPPQ